MTDEPLAGAGAGDVEQPALLDQQLARRGRRHQPVGADPVGAEDARAAAQVGPAVLLHVGDDDQPPLEALGAVRGQQAYGGAAGAALGQRVRGDLLGDQRGEELADADVVAGLLGPGGRVEQGADRVEVAVRPAGAPAAELDPLRGAGAASAVPDQSVHSSSSAVAPDVELGAGWCATRSATARARCTSAPVEPVERGGVEHRRGAPARASATGSRSSACAGSFSRLPQLPGQAAYVAGVEPAQRAGQQRLGPRGVDVVDVVGVVVVEVEHDPQGVDQRERGRVADQRHLVAGHLDRHAGGAERAAQRRDRLAPGPDQHGHLVPGDAVLEVRPPEQVGEVLGLGPVAVEGADDDPALAVVADLGRSAPGTPRARLSGMLPGSPMRPATRCAAVRMRGPNRRVVPSATTSAGVPSARGKSVGKSRMPRTSAPRNA